MGRGSVPKNRYDDEAEQERPNPAARIGDYEGLPVLVVLHLTGGAVGVGNGEGKDAVA